MAPPSPAQSGPQTSAADWLLFALLGVAAAAGAVLFFGYEYGRDQGIYATVAGAIARGGAPYLDAWDFKPPGIFAVYAAARLLLGPGMGAVRLVEIAAYASLLPACMLLSRRWLGDAKPGVLAAFVAFFAQVQLEYWDTAQPESFGGVAVAWALVCAARAEDAQDTAGRLRALFAAGLLYALAGLCKPHLGTGLAVSTFFVCRAARGRLASPWAALLAATAGAALVLLACLLWLVGKGAGPATFETFATFLPAYHALRFEWAQLPPLLLRTLTDALIGYAAFLPAGLLALAVLPPLAARERSALLHVGAVLALQLLGVAYQGRFYPYHFAASLMLLALPAGWGLWKLWLRARRTSWGVAVGLFVLGLLAVPAPAVPSYGAVDFWQRVDLRTRLLFGAVDPRARNLLHSAGDVHYGANRRVAKWLATRTEPGARVYVWGFEPMLYELAQRVPASRWIYNVPQRLDWPERRRARAELMQDLEREPPAAVVVVANDVRSGVTGNRSDSRTELDAFPGLRDWLARDYVRALRIEDFEILVPRN